jgi:hypothetical protein
LAEGDWLIAALVFALTAIISLLGIIFGNKYIENKEKNHEKEAINK